MMRVATSLVIVALLTAAATEARMNRQQEGNDSEDSSCIETFIELEESLVKQRSNNFIMLSFPATKSQGHAIKNQKEMLQ